MRFLALPAQLIGAKVTSATPGSIGDQTRKEAEFIKYTPNPNAPGYNNNAKQRVVRMVAAQVIYYISLESRQQ